MIFKKTTSAVASLRFRYRNYTASFRAGLDKTSGMVYNIMRIGVWPNGKALGLGPRSRRFDSCHSDDWYGLCRRKSRRVGILCGFFE